MATVMAECLEQIASDGLVRANSIPAGVYRDALRFSTLVFQATGESVPDNPPASLNAYVIADALLRLPQEEPKTREQIDEQVKQYKTFLEGLQTPRKLADEDKRLADSLRSFFVRLKEEGESEAYAKTMHLEPVPTGFPFR
jgi:hypothetical protein